MRCLPDPTEAFECWLLHPVAQAVEAGEVSADLLSELRAEIEVARELPQKEGHALAVQEIAERLGLSVDRVENMLAIFEAQPTVTRQRLLRRIVEAWLAGQRELYKAKQHGD